MESCWRGNLGASKGQFQKLTARAKVALLSPLEADTFSGQFCITHTSVGRTFSTTGPRVPMVLHIMAAALWEQSSVSKGSQLEYHALCSCVGLADRVPVR